MAGLGPSFETLLKHQHSSAWIAALATFATTAKFPYIPTPDAAVQTSMAISNAAKSATQDVQKRIIGSAAVCFAASENAALLPNNEWNQLVAVGATLAPNFCASKGSAIVKAARRQVPEKMATTLMSIATRRTVETAKIRKVPRTEIAAPLLDALRLDEILRLNTATAPSSKFSPDARYSAALTRCLTESCLRKRPIFPDSDLENTLQALPIEFQRWLVVAKKSASGPVKPSEVVQAFEDLPYRRPLVGAAVKILGENCGAWAAAARVLAKDGTQLGSTDSESKDPSQQVKPEVILPVAAALIRSHQHWQDGLEMLQQCALRSDSKFFKLPVRELRFIAKHVPQGKEFCRQFVKKWEGTLDTNITQDMALAQSLRLLHVAGTWEETLECLTLPLRMRSVGSSSSVQCVLRQAFSSSTELRKRILRTLPQLAAAGKTEMIVSIVSTLEDGPTPIMAPQPRGRRQQRIKMNPVGFRVWRRIVSQLHAADDVNGIAHISAAIPLRLRPAVLHLWFSPRVDVAINDLEKHQTSATNSEQALLKKKISQKNAHHIHLIAQAIRCKVVLSETQRKRLLQLSLSSDIPRSMWQLFGVRPEVDFASPNEQFAAEAATVLHQGKMATARYYVSCLESSYSLSMLDARLEELRKCIQRTETTHVAVPPRFWALPLALCDSRVLPAAAIALQRCRNPATLTRKLGLPNVALVLGALQLQNNKTSRKPFCRLLCARGKLGASRVCQRLCDRLLSVLNKSSLQCGSFQECRSWICSNLLESLSKLSSLSPEQRCQLQQLCLSMCCLAGVRGSASTWESAVRLATHNWALHCKEVEEGPSTNRGVPDAQVAMELAVAGASISCPRRRNRILLQALMAAKQNPDLSRKSSKPSVVLQTTKPYGQAEVASTQLSTFSFMRWLSDCSLVLRGSENKQFSSSASSALTRILSDKSVPEQYRGVVVARAQQRGIIDTHNTVLFSANFEAGTPAGDRAFVSALTTCTQGLTSDQLNKIEEILIAEGAMKANILTNPSKATTKK